MHRRPMIPTLTLTLTDAVTHVLHTSTVASGESGGPLVNGKMEVCGVHSFGDAFQGGERDVAVAVSNAAIVRWCSGLIGVNGWVQSWRRVR